MRKNMPSRKVLASYWKDRADCLGRDFEGFLYDGEVECFACGRDNWLHRAHIFPHVKGGSEDASNLHLLCSVCHEASEHYEREDYWRWLQVRRSRKRYNPADECITKRELDFGIDFEVELGSAISKAKTVHEAVDLLVERFALSFNVGEIIKDKLCDAPLDDYSDLAPQLKLVREFRQIG